MNPPLIECDVAVVGAGPSGLGLATALKRRGVARVLVLEREAAAGGIPRHCGHPPFGVSEFKRILTGPAYAERLARRAAAAGVDIALNHSTVSIGPGPQLHVATPDGPATVRARRIVLATGVRETPRSARLISGTRPLGVVTTGALQSMVYLQQRAPFTRPVILGSELVSFSAILTCRHLGIRPVAMVEKRARVTAWRGSALLPRALGIDLLTSSRLERIEGEDRVSAVCVVDSRGRPRRIGCDGVVVSGGFVSESALVRSSHLEWDHGTGGPEVDQHGRCSDPDFFAVGTMTHPADTAGRCWREGEGIAEFICRDLAESAPSANGRTIRLTPVDPAIRYVSPQRLQIDSGANGAPDPTIRVRFADPASGRLVASRGNAVIAAKNIRGLPERTATLTLPAALLAGIDPPIHFSIEPG